MSVSWTVPAERELVDIWLYIAADNLDAAERMVERLRAASQPLAAFPKLGRKGRRAETHELVVSGTNHILVYRVVKQGVEILHVRDGRRDPASWK
jgi:toxin ParE1/3/4